MAVDGFKFERGQYVKITNYDGMPIGWNHAARVKERCGTGKIYSIYTRDRSDAHGLYYRFEDPKMYCLEKWVVSGYEFEVGDMVRCFDLLDLEGSPAINGYIREAFNTQQQYKIVAMTTHKRRPMYKLAGCDNTIFDERWLAGSCDECHGTGWYVGLQIKDPCSRGCRPPEEKRS